MVAYLVRRYLLSILLAPLVVYSLLLYGPFPLTPYKVLSGVSDRYQYPKSWREWDMVVGLDKPWPLNYVSWLFDPNGNTLRGKSPLANNATVPHVIDVNVFGMRIQGGGALTGDCGYSYSGPPVSGRLGNGIGEFMLFLVVLLLGFMLVAVRQRRGRPRPHRVASPADPLDYGRYRAGRYTYE